MCKTLKQIANPRSYLWCKSMCRVQIWHMRNDSTNQDQGIMCIPSSLYHDFLYIYIYIYIYVCIICTITCYLYVYMYMCHDLLIISMCVCVYLHVCIVRQLTIYRPSTCDVFVLRVGIHTCDTYRTMHVSDGKQCTRPHTSTPKMSRSKRLHTHLTPTEQCMHASDGKQSHVQALSHRKWIDLNNYSHTYTGNDIMDTGRMHSCFLYCVNNR